MTVTFPNSNQQKHLVKQTGALEGQLLLAPKLIQGLPVSKYGGVKNPVFHQPQSPWG